MRRRRNGRPTSALGDMPWRNGICHARQSPSAPTSSSTRWCRRLVRLAPPISSSYDDEPFSKKGRARDARTGKKKSQTSVTQSINTKKSPYTYVCVVLNEGEKTPSTDPLRMAVSVLLSIPAVLSLPHVSSPVSISLSLPFLIPHTHLSSSSSSSSSLDVLPLHQCFLMRYSSPKTSAPPPGRPELMQT